MKESKPPVSLQMNTSTSIHMKSKQLFQLISLIILSFHSPSKQTLCQGFTASKAKFLGEMLGSKMGTRTLGTPENKQIWGRRLMKELIKTIFLI